MATREHGQPQLLLPSGVFVGVDAAGHWTVSHGLNSYHLDVVADFFRVWLLLERTFEDVSRDLSRISGSSAAARFPYGKLVASALTAQSAYWSEKAAAWLPFLTEPERAELVPLVQEACSARWANQRTRQIIGRYL